MNKEQMVEKLIGIGQDADMLTTMNDEQIKALYDKKFPSQGKKIGQFSGIVFPRKGGLEGFEESVGSFNDSSPFNFHKSTTRVTKSGENAGRVYFVAPRLSEGKNGCFTMDEMVALELEHNGLGLVGGEKVTVDGRDGIKDPYLNLAREVVGQKIKGVLRLVE